MATANKIVRETPVIKTILIVSNSTAAISNITWTNTHPSQQLLILFATKAYKFMERDADTRIQIMWVPGHKGIELNKLVDREAQRGFKKEDNIIKTSLSYYKEKTS